jgi:hypothetical protein
MPVQQWPPSPTWAVPWTNPYVPNVSVAYLGQQYPQQLYYPGMLPSVTPTGTSPAYASGPFAAGAPTPTPGGGYQVYSTGGAAAGYRLPQSHPAVDPHMPAANMTNSTGGVGCEPGYNYFFPAEHTKIHLLKAGGTPPWQLPPNSVVPFAAVHVPCATTLAELLRGFGATNPVAKKNKCWEVTQGGNGRWYKGLSFNGDEEKKMKVTLKEMGWDMTRSGRPGERPVVYLYVIRD